MNNFHSPGGNQPPAGPNAYKKGFGFIRSSIRPSFQDPIIELVKILPKFSRIVAPQSRKISHDATIPLINLDQLSETKGDARKTLIKGYGDALRQEGFVAVHAKSLNQLIDQVYAEMKRYYSQSFDQKILDWQGYLGLQGYLHQGMEIAPNAKQADIKESYYVPIGHNKWPKYSPSFARTVSDYQSYMFEYSKSLLKVLYEYLGRAHAEVDQSLSPRDSILRLTHYPTLKPTDHAEALWAAPHKDTNVITIMPPGSIPGLEVLTPQGNWKPIIVPNGYIIVGVGLQLEHKTAGLIKARTHRVINPGGRLTLAERYSTAFFGSYFSDFSLKPFEQCVQVVTHGMTPKRKASFMKQYPSINTNSSMKFHNMDSGFSSLDSDPRSRTLSMK
jgi:isopenicillin N synthase-like dioxygenase